MSFESGMNQVNKQITNPPYPSSELEGAGLYSEDRNRKMRLGWSARGAGVLLVSAALAASPTLAQGAPSADESARQIDHPVLSPETNSLQQDEVIFQTPTILSSYANPRSALEKKKERLMQKICDRQQEIDPQAYSTCDFPAAYAAVEKKHPKWNQLNEISRPGKENLRDREKLYFSTHYGEYKKYMAAVEAGALYQSPNNAMWDDKVNYYECKDTWDCNTGNGYYGGLQMDRGFAGTYNPQAYVRWGLPNNWSDKMQKLAADRAFYGYDGHPPRGLEPWPTSYGKYRYLYPKPAGTVHIDVIAHSPGVILLKKPKSLV